MKSEQALALFSMALFGVGSCTPTNCGDLEGSVGPTTIPCLRVLVMDSQTGTPVDSATVTVMGEGINETLVLNAGRWGLELAYAESMHQGVYQAGTYQVNVVAAGYEPVVLEDIVIPPGRYFDQGVVPVDLVVELTPTSVGPAQRGQ